MDKDPKPSAVDPVLSLLTESDNYLVTGDGSGPFVRPAGPTDLTTWRASKISAPGDISRGVLPRFSIPFPGIKAVDGCDRIIRWATPSVRRLCRLDLESRKPGSGPRDPESGRSMISPMGQVNWA